MSKCLLVGIEKNDFTNKNTGELVSCSILHVVWDKPRLSDPKLMGQRVEPVKCFFTLPQLTIGKRYDIVYGAVTMGNKTFARIEDIVPID